MNETMKIVAAVAGFFIVGFIMVGMSKNETVEQKEAASMIRNYVAMQTMASDKCTVAIKNATGEQVYFPSDTQSDKDTYITMTWVGESKTGFKKATCTLKASLGGISDLVIDDKVITKKDVK